MAPMVCKCNYTMANRRGYWKCTKCGRVKDKKDVKSRIVRFILKIFYK